MIGVVTTSDFLRPALPFPRNKARDIQPPGRKIPGALLKDEYRPSLSAMRAWENEGGLIQAAKI